LNIPWQTISEAYSYGTAGQTKESLILRGPGQIPDRNFQAITSPWRCTGSRSLLSVPETEGQGSTHLVLHSQQSQQAFTVNHTKTKNKKKKEVISMVFLGPESNRCSVKGINA
jgi:hypothetical protein